MISRQALLLLLLTVALGGCVGEHDTAGNIPGAPDSANTALAEEPTEQDLPSPAEPALNYAAREGRVLYRHYCSTCHGDTGRGDGFNAFNLDPKPRDLSAADFQTARSDADLQEVIREGGAAVGLSTTMPPWGRTLNERAIHYLTAYLRNLPAEEE